MTTTNSPVRQLEAVINTMESHLAGPAENRFNEGFNEAINRYMPAMQNLLGALIARESEATETVPAETLSARNIDQDILIRAEVRQVYHTGAETILSIVHQYEDQDHPALTEISMNHNTPVTFAGKATR